MGSFFEEHNYQVTKTDTRRSKKNLSNTRSIVEIEYGVENSLAQRFRFTWLLGEVYQLFKEEIKSILHQFFGIRGKKMEQFSVHSEASVNLVTKLQTYLCLGR